ncbi:hypothetical protein L2E82_14572 [Cichorium intybus]|uniref:Uncharacterized protein n=1 Tax=Cichorium intybus TaxID=13427 RepID=A0ACB9F1J3_CICIN|nr:hypothetical protein L2E82_14572 [Cichorium intybus]
MNADCVFLFEFLLRFGPGVLFLVFFVPGKYLVTTFVVLFNLKFFSTIPPLCYKGAAALLVSPARLRPLVTA